MPRWLVNLLAIGAFAAALGWVGSRTLANLNVPGAPHRDQWGMVDFRDAIYYSGRAMRDGINPYDLKVYAETYPVGNIFPLYSPFIPLAHFPLTAFDLPTAQAIYFGWTALLTLVFAALTLSACRLPVGVAEMFGLGAVIVVSRPGWANIVLGQLGMEFAVGVVLALHFARTRPWLSAVGVLIATAKVTFGLTLVVLMAARGDWKGLLRGLLLAAVVAGGGLVWIASYVGWGQLWQSLPETHAVLQANPGFKPLTGWMRIDAFATMCRLVGRELPTGVELTIWWGGIAVCAGVIWRLRMSADDEGRETSMVIVALACLSLIYHLIYDANLLFFPLVTMASGGVGSLTGASPRVRWTVAGLISIPLANYLLTNWGIELARAQGSWAYTLVSTANGVALAVGLAICLVMAWRRSQNASANRR